jgi:hypothetical protein
MAITMAITITLSLCRNYWPHSNQILKLMIFSTGYSLSISTWLSLFYQIQNISIMVFTMTIKLSTKLVGVFGWDIDIKDINIRTLARDCNNNFNRDCHQPEDSKIVKKSALYVVPVLRCRPVLVKCKCFLSKFLKSQFSAAFKTNCNKILIYMIENQFQ